jgi:hypothetical protein
MATKQRVGGGGRMVGDHYYDRCRILVAAMVENAMQDAARLYRKGLWLDDPVDMALLDNDDVKGVGRVYSARVAEERQFWCSDACDTMLKVAYALIPLRVSRRQFIEGVVKLAKRGGAEICDPHPKLPVNEGDEGDANL